MADATVPTMPTHAATKEDLALLGALVAVVAALFKPVKWLGAWVINGVIRHLLRDELKQVGEIPLINQKLDTLSSTCNRIDLNIASFLAEASQLSRDVGKVEGALEERRRAEDQT